MKHAIPKLAPALTTMSVLALLVGCSQGIGTGTGTSTTPTTTGKRVAGMVYGDYTVTSNESGQQCVAVPVVAQDGIHTVTTEYSSPQNTSDIETNLAVGNLIDWIPGDSTAVAKVPTKTSSTFNKILAKGSSATAQFVLGKYGMLTINDGVPGNMVAAGWVYAKGTNSITIGDGRTVTADVNGLAYSAPIRRYTDTYNVSSDVKVFSVNTSDYSSCAASTFDAIPVTPDYLCTTKSRQAVYAVFDRNYKDYSNAKIVALWYFTPKTSTAGYPAVDIPVDSIWMSSLMGTDPVTGAAYSSFSNKYSKPDGEPYDRSTEPFEIVKDTMYYVGDNEVASYVFRCDMGYPNDSTKWKYLKVDCGWPNCGYIYYRNMELMGLDPRAVTDIWLTHGHADHYGTAVDHMHLLDNSAKSFTLWGSLQDTFGITNDEQGNYWDIAGALPSSETEIRSRTSKTYEYDQWYDFGNVKVYVVWSPGHTAGTTNMVFKVKNPVDNTYHTFGYHGGYGYNGMYTSTAANGWLRLCFQHGFSYLQQNLDSDYVAPQHSNQYPILEVYQALKAYNRANGTSLTMMDAMTEKLADSSTDSSGVALMSEFMNQCEKRRSVVSYATSDTNNASYKSIQTSGPFKPGRESGLSNVSVTVLGTPKIIQGFNKYMNKNPKITLLASGVANNTDAYVHDPTGYYVQVELDVLESTYKGYMPDGYSQYSTGEAVTIAYVGGPVESIHPAKGTNHPPEYLRTQRLSSLADAQTILATLTKGHSYTISLNSGSEIVVPANVSQTFVAK